MSLMPLIPQPVITGIPEKLAESQCSKSSALFLHHRKEIQPISNRIQMCETQCFMAVIDTTALFLTQLSFNVVKKQQNHQTDNIFCYLHFALTAPRTKE